MTTTTLPTTSITNQQWKLREVSEREVLALSQRHNLPEIVARVLVGRGITLETAENFLHPTLRNTMPDPFHLKDMEKAAARITDAITQKESIAIFGDYDVDGATSSALLHRFFSALGNPPRIYIPDRIAEGYGPNSPALRKLKAEGVQLVITVDCGTVSYEPLADAKAVGLEVIVVDHHLGSENLPEAVAVINPNRQDETSEQRHLAAVGVSFLLAVAVRSTLKARGFFANKEEPDMMALLDVVALGTVCDVMPLTGLNRTFVAQGLKIMAARKNVGLRALADVAGLDKAPDAYHLGFVFGPRINAGGRVGEAGLGAELLTTENPDYAREIAQKLHRHNEERKAIEMQVLEEAIEQVEQKDPEAPMLIVAAEGWHPGVIGIVAGRLKERYNRPTAVIALENGVGKASARSVSGVDMGTAVSNAKASGLLLAGGGHAMAAGFSVEAAQLPALEAFFHALLLPYKALYETRRLSLDGMLSTAAVTVALAKTLEGAAPYGMGNPKPRFALIDAYVMRSEIMGADHIRCMLGSSRTGGSAGAIKGVAFRAVGSILGQTLLNAQGKTLQIAGQISLNSWQGRESAEFLIEDVMEA